MEIDASDFAIHLSSVRSVDDANTEWVRLKNSLDLPASWPQRTPELEIEGKGVFYRVAGGAFDDRNDAVTACEKIKSQGQYCSIIAR
ncbi:MAG: SPOR domain-containing protein [Geminicoccaceae bacterium]